MGLGEGGENGEEGGRGRGKAGRAQAISAAALPRALSPSFPLSLLPSLVGSMPKALRPPSQARRVKKASEAGTTASGEGKGKGRMGWDGRGGGFCLRNGKKGWVLQVCIILWDSGTSVLYEPTVEDFIRNDMDEARDVKEEYDSDPSDTGSSDDEGSGSGSEGEKEKRRKVRLIFINRQ